MNTTFSATGFTELFVALDALGKVKAKGIWRKAVRAGGSVLLKAVRPRVPKELGVLVKSMGLRVKARRKDGVVVCVVGPRRKFKKVVAGKMRWASMYAHLAHGGRKAFTATSKTGHTWHVPAAKGTRYLADAAAASQGQIIEAMKNKIAEEIAKHGI